MWTDPFSWHKEVMQPRVCVGLIILSPCWNRARTFGRAGAPLLRADLDRKLVAAALLRPVFLLLYNAASATLTRFSANLRTPSGTDSRPQSPKLAVTSMLWFRIAARMPQRVIDILEMIDVA
jgi:hypothetical protein